MGNDLSVDFATSSRSADQYNLRFTDFFLHFITKGYGKGYG